MAANKTKPAGVETAPRVLLFDIETFPNLALTWDAMWEANLIKIVRHRQVASFAWKWLDEKEIHWRGLPSYPGYKRDRFNNRLLMRDLRDLYSKADVVLVGHNVKRFDERRSNTDIIKNDLTPPAPHRFVDTCEFAKHKFDFNSNKLDDLGVFLGIGRKVKHRGFDMWEECMDGSPEAWEEFKGYNIGDVALLERVYLKMRPWMTKHPSLIPTDRAVFACPYCQGRIKASGYSYYASGKRQRYACLERDCGRWSSGHAVKRELRIR